MNLTMQDKAIFDPEKMALAEVKVLKAQVETPEFFDHTKVVGHPLDFSLKLGFSLEERLAKADFSIQIKTDSKGENEEEAQGEFQLVFIYKIENLDELVVLEKNKQPKLNPGLLPLFLL